METEVWRDYGEIKEYDVSGVDKVDNHSEAKEVSRYSLDGQRLSVPVKGLNIVRYSDWQHKESCSQLSFLRWSCQQGRTEIGLPFGKAKSSSLLTLSAKHAK